jgi:late competence protein required for DNA uptake (superfamily II DNA/RNA helicase)
MTTFTTASIRAIKLAFSMNYNLEELLIANVDSDTTPLEEAQYILSNQEELQMFTEQLEMLLIAYVDSFSIDQEVAMYLNETAVNKEQLEEMLISCVDSETVSLEVAQNILAAL